MKKIVAIAALLILSGCNGQEPIAVTETNNPNVPVGLLFEIDGCSIYRFADDGRFVYFTNCAGSVTVADTENCGKGCTRYINRTVETRIIPNE